MSPTISDRLSTATWEAATAAQRNAWGRWITSQAEFYVWRGFPGIAELIGFLDERLTPQQAWGIHREDDGWAVQGQESGIGGAYFVESLVDALWAAVVGLLERGGSDGD